MSDPTARGLALSAARELRRADHHTDLVGAAATATVAIALHLTEPAAPGFLPVLTGDDSLVEQIARTLVEQIARTLFADDDRLFGHDVAWDALPASSRDEYRSNARAVLALLNSLAPEQGPSSSETRQATGLQRLTEPEPTPAKLWPPTLTVEPVKWGISLHEHRACHYITRQYDGTYYSPRTGIAYPTLTEAVAAIVKAAS